MGAVCDVYDISTRRGPYKAAWDPAGSIQRMGSGRPFDSNVSSRPCALRGHLPGGTLVRLQSGPPGRGVDQEPRRRWCRRVKVFFPTKSNMPIPITTIDLAAQGVTDKIVGREPPENFGFKHLDDLWKLAPAWALRLCQDAAPDTAFWALLRAVSSIDTAGFSRHFAHVRLDVPPFVLFVLTAGLLAACGRRRRGQQQQQRRQRRHARRSGWRGRHHRALGQRQGHRAGRQGASIGTGTTHGSDGSYASPCPPAHPRGHSLCRSRVWMLRAARS